MRRKLPSLQALACLDAAVRHESYTRAADELALTQGAVSRQIAALEAWVGTPLFRRTRHGVVPTPAGAAYARQVARHLDGLERVTLDAMSRDGLGGSLQLAVVPSFATRWLIPRLGALAAMAPELTVHVDVRTRPFLFADTPYDAAIHAGTPEQLTAWAGTRATPLLQELIVPVASPALLAGHAAITPADVAGLPLLQAGTRPEAWRQWFETQGVAAPEAMRGPRYELFSMLVAAACHGLGAALVPLLLVEDELARGELRALHPEALPSGRIYSLVVPERAEAAPLLQRFADWLLAQAAAGVPVENAGP